MKKETYYRMVATYHREADIRNLAGKSADEIVTYYNSGKGNPQTHLMSDEKGDIILEDEGENIKKGYTRMSSDGKYLVSDGTCGLDASKQSVEAHIDIYRLFVSRIIPEVFAINGTYACEMPDGRFLFRDSTFEMSIRKKIAGAYDTVEKGIIGGTMMRDEQEFLQNAMWFIAERFPLPKEDKYNNEVCRMVNSCHREMMEMARRFGIARIDFSLHPDIEPVSARFDDEQGRCGYEEITTLAFDREHDMIRIRSEHFSAYTDDTYGDYFNVADKLPLLYQAMVRILQEYDIKPEERTA